MDAGARLGLSSLFICLLLVLISMLVLVLALEATYRTYMMRRKMKDKINYLIRPTFYIYNSE